MTGRAEVVAYIGALRRRDLVLSAITGATVGLSAGTVLGTLSGLVWGVAGLQERVIIAGIVGLIGGIVAGTFVASRRNTVADVEHRIPAFRNFLMTASELIDGPARGTTPSVTDLVFTRTADLTRQIPPSKAFPFRHSAFALVVALGTWVAMMTFTASQDPVAPLTFGTPAPADAVGTIDVTITPPAYTRRDAYRMSNPARIEALAGSRIDLRIRGQNVRVETLDGTLTPRDTAGRFSFNAQTDGFVAISAGASERRLIGLTVTPDETPRVRVTAPGRDLFLADAKRVLPVEITALDDIALTTLKLRYTKVSGSGERFTFVEGEVPVTLTRTSEVDWRAKATLDLSALQLEQGDMIVYRGAAADGRPGVGLTESDAFIVEITAPGSVAAEGFAADDLQDKYAISQQMVILKTERLLARAATIAPESLTYYAQSLAAEQRSVRAEFVFMMGGEVAEDVVGADIDETHEAENEDEILAGRLVNRGRNALISAIRQMSRASALLNDGNAKDALPVEKQALANLQQAFSRTRYLLRALTLRERLDLSRRLTGPLTLAASNTRPQATVSVDSGVAALRRALSEISMISAGQRPQSAAGVVAQSVLAVDPSDSTLQRVATRLSESRFDDAARELAAALRARLPRESAETESAELRRLRGSLNDALRGRGGGGR